MGLWLLVGLSALLVAVVVLLVLALPGGSDVQKDDGEMAGQRDHVPLHLRLKHRRKGGDPAPPPAKGKFLSSADRVRTVLGHVRQGAMTDEELDTAGNRGANIAVTVQGPTGIEEKKKLDPEFNAAMKSVQPKIVECYQSRLADKPGLGGKLVLSLKLKKDEAQRGVLDSASIKESTVKDYALESCILKRLKSIEFMGFLADRKTVDGKVRTWEYPLTFKQGVDTSSWNKDVPGLPPPAPPAEGRPPGPETKAPGTEPPPGPGGPEPKAAGARELLPPGKRPPPGEPGPSGDEPPPPPGKIPPPPPDEPGER